MGTQTLMSRRGAKQRRFHHTPHVSREEAARILSMKAPQLIDFTGILNTKVCAFCGCESVGLHRHHHPIPKIQGGRKTVRICANCHAEFHWSTTAVDWDKVVEGLV